jgi:hypothetical protein
MAKGFCSRINYKDLTPQHLYSQLLSLVRPQSLLLHKNKDLTPFRTDVPSVVNKSLLPSRIFPTGAVDFLQKTY